MKQKGKYRDDASVKGRERRKMEERRKEEEKNVIICKTRNRYDYLKTIAGILLVKLLVDSHHLDLSSLFNVTEGVWVVSV